MGALAESGSADGYYYAGRVRRAPALRAHHLPTPSRRRAAELWNFGGPGQTRVGLGCGRTRVVLSRSLGGQVYVLIVDVDGSPRPQGEGATGRKWTDISGVAWAVATRDIQRERERGGRHCFAEGRRWNLSRLVSSHPCVGASLRTGNTGGGVYGRFSEWSYVVPFCHSALLFSLPILSYPIPARIAGQDSSSRDGRTDGCSSRTPRSRRRDLRRRRCRCRLPGDSMTSVRMDDGQQGSP